MTFLNPKSRKEIYYLNTRNYERIISSKYFPLIIDNLDLSRLALYDSKLVTYFVPVARMDVNKLFEDLFSLFYINKKQLLKSLNAPLAIFILIYTSREISISANHLYNIISLQVVKLFSSNRILNTISYNYYIFV